MPTLKGELQTELLELIGEAGLVRLAEAFGGTRLLIPATVHADHQIAQAIGIRQAQRLVARFAPDVIKVPLAREMRAVQYRRTGASNGQIAGRLGITESGVEKLFARLAARGE